MVTAIEDNKGLFDKTSWLKNKQSSIFCSVYQRDIKTNGDILGFSGSKNKGYY